MTATIYRRKPYKADRRRLRREVRAMKAAFVNGGSAQ